MYCRDQRNQAFEDCGGVIRLVVIAVIHLVYSRYVLSLWAKIGIFDTLIKPMKVCLFFTVFCMNRRHQCRIKHPCQMCTPQT